MAQRADCRALNDTVVINGCVIRGRIPVPRCAFTTPKIAKVPMSPRRIVVFKPSVILKQRINGHASDNSEWQDPAEQLIGSISRNTH